MINRYMALLLEELAGEGIPDPLGEPFTLAALWDDLARLAGERPPAAVRRLHDADGPSINPQRPEGGLAPGLVRATKPARVISSP